MTEFDWWVIGIVIVVAILAGGDHNDPNGSVWSEGE